MGTEAKKAGKVLRRSSEQQKNEALRLMAKELLHHSKDILDSNRTDLKNGRENGLSDAMLERLTLNEARLRSMAEGIDKIIGLKDPLTEGLGEWTTPEGLRIARRSVPLGVIGIIYESRPNVTADASALCIKAGNAVILRGGKEAMESNKAIVKALQQGLSKSDLPAKSIQLITDPSRTFAASFMQANEYIDCLIPRGGAGLIKAVLTQATVPVIETGTGNCHIYVHEDADLAMAEQILLNGKVQRPSVCNALETLLIDKNAAAEFLPVLAESLVNEGVEVIGGEREKQISSSITIGEVSAYDTEFLDLKIAVKVVEGYDQALEHIEKYSTGHSEVIITDSYHTALSFQEDIDSAQVYVNASTRFSDGEMFGFGGEIGISTQKLHARGPMGLNALTSYKYTILGNGQIRK
ncbi:glutamate-5-semialdehyde dehydrogenase [Jeotgalicoccus nanhaiensis]|uniref:Gamma-glutamyl phosphate reductase n=1 Tax=Jeotgalicoccus nanhaiensis TaxID=568603 RepID=A0ABR9Y0Y9_9STAP|nr:glutamate-5-semialdehyde dehydrogenase [Jeotgalicoccus nanhaiensis]TFU60826.1 glutamate-5-semialdehyde dehydrogenase [Jeotgalicoccus nanhaiensis]